MILYPEDIKDEYYFKLRDRGFDQDDFNLISLLLAVYQDGYQNGYDDFREELDTDEEN